MTVAEKIREKGFTGELKESEPLYRHLSLRVGGPAALFAVPDTTEDIIVLLKSLEEDGLPWVLLGGGTNVVFANGGYGGCVIQLGAEFARIQEENEARLLAGAAVSLPALVAGTAEKGLSGLECLAGIPGSVGGAVFMNAGTKSGEIADVIRDVRLLNGKDDRWVPREDLQFSYRSSGISQDNIVLAARLDLLSSSADEVRTRIRAESEQRRQTQPAGLPSAG
jgi:UDP-N-acetylmuramate dehydrogenase